MITFLDNLLQSQMLATPFRKLMVPVMVKNIRIDPKVLFETVKQNRTNDSSNVTSLEDKSVAQYRQDETAHQVMADNRGDFQQLINDMNEKLCIFKSWVPFYFDANTRILIAPGVEIEHVLALPIPRRMPSSLVLDSYEWVANEDNSAINECDKQYIDQYIEVIK